MNDRGGSSSGLVMEISRDEFMNLGFMPRSEPAMSESFHLVSSDFTSILCSGILVG